MINTASLRFTDLDRSGPLRPFEQLLCVMPLSSAEKTVPNILYDADKRGFVAYFKLNYNGEVAYLGVSESVHPIENC